MSKNQFKLDLLSTTKLLHYKFIYFDDDDDENNFKLKKKTLFFYNNNNKNIFVMFKFQVNHSNFGDEMR